MFADKQSKEQLAIYKKMLIYMGQLSKLSSESSVPYLGYRIVENIFCEAFGANNLSRSDCSADAAKDKIGIGIKTFVNGNGRTYQKVAEFNRDLSLYKGKTSKEIIEIVAHLRNERLNATKRIHGIDELIYHCVTRAEGKIIVYEQPMEEVNIKTIKNIDPSKKNTISFNDGINEYSFNISKSTLYKRFETKNELLSIDVNIIEKPFDLLNTLFSARKSKQEFSKQKEEEHIFLPLFSDKGGRNVPERSGLNQWNAAGRPRDYNEIYIPIPSWIHKTFPDFLLPRDTSFNLILPNGETLSAKVCQDGGKALMSNPNLALGKWLLRDVMNLKEGELLTYERLEELGLDSVVIHKTGHDTFTINFCEIGSYDIFKQAYE